MSELQASSAFSMSTLEGVFLQSYVALRSGTENNVATAIHGMPIGSPLSITVLPFTVISKANPWRAFDSTAASGEDPVRVRLSNVPSGSEISWNASGGLALGGTGTSPSPDGNPMSMLSHPPQNGVTSLGGQSGSLVGVWSNGVSFIMGTSGTLAVPNGVSELYMGILDSTDYSDNSGDYLVQFRISPP